MLSPRAFIRDHRRLAIVLVALALCMKMMVPTGFMVGAAGKTLSITICDGREPERTQQVILLQTGQSPDKTAEHGKASDPCPYAALTMVALSAASAALLALSLAFILERGMWPVARSQPATRSFLRPPLRAPPHRG